MGDMAKGITAFKKGLKDEQSNDSEAKVIERSSEQDTVDVSSTSNKDTAAKS